jgi:hypothetical protein
MIVMGASSEHELARLAAGLYFCSAGFTTSSVGVPRHEWRHLQPYTGADSSYSQSKRKVGGRSGGEERKPR